MCLVIDANVAGDFAASTEDVKPIMNRVLKGSLRVVAGPELKRELLKTRFRTLYQQWLLAGKLTEYSSQQVETAANEIDEKLLASNDIHILALARASGARILYSKDEPLHSDFKNTRIISPKGKVYTSPSHQRLLDEARCSCH